MRRTVLMHPPPDAEPASRYVQSLTAALREVGFDVKPLSFRNVLTASDAVVHVHWPEHLFGDPAVAKSLLKLTAGRAVLGLARLRRQPLVWTAHNIEPHGGWSVGAASASRWLRKQAGSIVVLCEGQQDELIEEFPELEADRFVSLPEGQLHDHPPLDVATADGRPLRLLHLGVLIEYKQQRAVIQGLAPHLEAGRVAIRVVGRSGGDAYSNEVEALAKSLPGLEFIGRRVSEEELIDLVEWCDAAVGVQKPAFNTGVPAAVLPLGRRVILSESSQSSFLRGRVGDDWVIEIGDPRSATEWSTVLDRLRSAPIETVDAALFSWKRIAEGHRDLYDTLS